MYITSQIKNLQNISEYFSRRAYLHSQHKLFTTPTNSSAMHSMLLQFAVEIKSIEQQAENKNNNYIQ